jgi:CRP-like cAMP-binding protein
MTNEIIKKLKKNKLFKNVEILKLNKELVEKKPSAYQPNQLIYAKNSTADSIFLILSGKVNVINYDFVDKSKNMDTSTLYSENDFFGYKDLSNRSKRKSTCISLEQTEILEISELELEKLVKENIRIIENLNETVFAADPKVMKEEPEPVNRTKKIVNATSSEFDFKGKKENSGHISEKKENDYYSDLQKMKESLEKEKEYAEEAIRREMEELTKREKEIEEKEKALIREKEFAEKLLAQELEEISKKEEDVTNLEDALLKEESQAQKLIKQKIAELKQRELELKTKNKSLQKDQKLSEEAIQKAKELAEKEKELLQRSDALEKRKK